MSVGAEVPWSSQKINGNATAIALGERLFFDSGLSANGQISCAGCHQPAKQFSDGLPLAVGLNGRKGTRNTPSLLDVGQQRSLFGDGRRESLEAQALDPLLNPSEHGLANEAALLKRLRSDARYVRSFRAAFGVRSADITVQYVAQALAAFQRTLVSGPSPFDRYLAGETTALELAARRGWQLFSNQAQCIRCHSVEPKDGSGVFRPLFTDHQFHSLAVGFTRVERKLPELTARLVQLHRDGRAFDHEVLSDQDISELGRFAFTLNPADIGRFKTPSLRDVALTAPYMHDGSVATLEESVDLELYYRGAQDGKPLILTPQERADLVAFLRSLSSASNSAANRATAHLPVKSTLQEFKRKENLRK